MWCFIDYTNNKMKHVKHMTPHFCRPGRNYGTYWISRTCRAYLVALMHGCGLSFQRKLLKSGRSVTITPFIYQGSVRLPTILRCTTLNTLTPIRMQKLSSTATINHSWIQTICLAFIFASTNIVRHCAPSTHYLQTCFDSTWTTRR